MTNTNRVTCGSKTGRCLEGEVNSKWAVNFVRQYGVFLFVKDITDMVFKTLEILYSKQIIEQVVKTT